MKKSILVPLIGLSALLILIFSLTGGHDKIEVSCTSANVNTNVHIPKVKVFIENSGSMDGYMCAGSQLKDAVYDYVSDINRVSDTTKLFYINSQLIPYEKDLASYVKDLSPESFRRYGGNRSNTDFGNVMASVLKSVDDTTVSILISDCILDLQSKNAIDYLTNCQIRIKDEVINAQKRVNNLGIEILKLSSDFKGKYYYPNGRFEVLQDVKRPYYIWIIGNKEALAELNRKVPLSLFDRYNLEGMVAFTNQSSIPYDITKQNRNSCSWRLSLHH